jgi:hypothetical protein
MLDSWRINRYVLSKRRAPFTQWQRHIAGRPESMLTCFNIPKLVFFCFTSWNTLATCQLRGYIDPVHYRERLPLVATVGATQFTYGVRLLRGSVGVWLTPAFSGVQLLSAIEQTLHCTKASEYFGMHRRCSIDSHTLQKVLAPTVEVSAA